MPSYKTNSCANSEILYRAFLNGFAAQVSNHSKEVTYKRSKMSPTHRRKRKKKEKKFTLLCKISTNPWKWEFKHWQHSNNALTNHRISRARKPRL
jgi:hypothetical protein